MATKVHMEALSPTMEEGQLVRWLKNEGDAVKDGDILAEIETDKATMELVARGSGVLQNITLKAGDTAPVGQVIALIGEAGAAPPADAAPKQVAEKQEASTQASTASEEPAKTAAPSRQEGAKESSNRSDAQVRAGAEDVASRGETEKPREALGSMVRTQTAGAARANGESAEGDVDASGRVRASPLARRLASDAGLDLSGVEGTGPGGRITKKDIEAAVKDGPATKAGAAGGARQAAQRAIPVVRRDSSAESEEIPLTQMRKTIAKRLATSIGPVPTFYLTREFDMTRVMEARERINARLEKQGVKVSVNDIIIKAVAAALVRHPEVNAAWGDSAITRHYRAHIGVAVAVDDGLITPIIRDADVKSVSEIAQEVLELAGRAREKKLKPEEYTGATFSISNLGMFGIQEFTAIINPPEAAILAVGAVEEKVVAVNGEIGVQPRMRVTMSCDHRVIDGATGAKFMQTLAEFMEEPLMMVM